MTDRSAVRPAPTVMAPAALLVALLTSLALLVGPLSVPAEAARYTPPAGVRTNNPLGDREARRQVLGHLIRSIDAVPRKGQIKVASWNIRSDDVVDALIRAHSKRRVGVKVVLDRLNANPDNRNRGIDRLQRALKQGNDNRRPALRSGLRKCVSACRGRSGIAHSKFFLFSKAGRARWVVMNGSANATDLAAYGQWNDVYTIRGKKAVFKEMKTVFAQMYRDRNVDQPYRARRFGDTTVMTYPWRGSGTKGDPVLREMSKISCTGARNNRSGKTKIRIAMTSWHGERGKKIAWAVRRKQNRGCDVRIVYAVAGNEVLRILRREGARPVPLRQIVQDPNGDGVYDRYLHMKVLTVKGHYGQDRSAWVTLNGSANWSPAALASDEVVMRIKRKGVLQRYNRWIDWLYRNPPPRTASRTTAGRTSTTAPAPVVLPEHLPLGSRVDGVDPYALIPRG